WEGRRLWGQLINTTRTLTRQIQTLTHADGEDHEREAHRDFERRHIYMLAAYVHALRHHLRDEPHFDDCAPLLDARLHSALAGDPNPPIALLDRLGRAFAAAWRRGWIDRMHLPLFEQTLTVLTDIQGGCERIKKTPIPFAYTVLMHRLV